MFKDAPISVRLPTALREALNAAAAADQRTLAGLVTKVLVEWCAEHGWLKVDGHKMTAVTDRRQRQTRDGPRRRGDD